MIANGSIIVYIIVLEIFTYVQIYIYNYDIFCNLECLKTVDVT
jgi:hypothetical protein